MPENLDQPRKDDAVLGGNSPPRTAVVLDGLEGVKRSLASSVEAQRILALKDALNYGESGLDLVILALLDESREVMWAAYSLLRTKTETKVKIALLEFNPYQFFECLCTLEGHSDRVHSVAIAPDGKTIVSGSADYTIKVWDLEAGECKGTLHGHSHWVDSVAITPDGKTIVSGGRDEPTFCGTCIRSNFKVWDILTGECQRTLSEKIIYRSNIQELDIKTGKCLHLLNKFLWRFHSVAIAPDGKTIVSGSADYTIKVWDLEAGECKGTLQGHLAYDVSSVAIAPDSKTIVMGSSDKTIFVWDLVTCESLGTFSGHSDYVLCVAIAPDAKTIVSGSKDNTIRVWDLVTGECLRTLEGHSDYVMSVAITPDGRTIVSGSGDKTIKVWGMG